MGVGRTENNLNFHFSENSACLLRVQYCNSYIQSQVCSLGMIYKRCTNRAVLAALELFVPAVSYTDSLLFMDGFLKMRF